CAKDRDPSYYYADSYHTNDLDSW
nr:immunoglobulin heavy chain junction region [Macaca mulatta]MOW88898.1 immunoglobulin heavy chain junction region [Macaca mulatta]MOW89933.1 immunoglobulin heavy chain junction region [Macaca mulatta]MOW92457.1 immunoglobulin heavy chain junction region [Macaca mulatta]MOW93294.1 immunoglobulin heavy chain junction region [Macaca mulatta]